MGVYVGSDSPSPLGKYETGSKTALPIFKDFIKQVWPKIFVGMKNLILVFDESYTSIQISKVNFHKRNWDPK